MNSQPLDNKIDELIRNEDSSVWLIQIKSELIWVISFRMGLGRNLSTCSRHYLQGRESVERFRPLNRFPTGRGAVGGVRSKALMHPYLLGSETAPTSGPISLSATTFTIQKQLGILHFHLVSMPQIFALVLVELGSSFTHTTLYTLRIFHSTSLM